MRGIWWIAWTTDPMELPKLKEPTLGMAASCAGSTFEMIAPPREMLTDAPNSLNTITSFYPSLIKGSEHTGRTRRLKC